MRIGIVTLWILLAATSASAEYYNQRNIVDKCAKDSSFGSECYTYLAAYRDFIAFMARATDAERAKVSCIFGLDTKRVAKRLAQAKPLSQSYQVPKLIIDEFCN